MSVELAFINQLLTKPTAAATVSLPAGGLITKGSQISINDEGKANMSSYNLIPDNTIAEYFGDHQHLLTPSTSSVAPYGTNPMFKRIGTDKYAYLLSEYDSVSTRYSLNLYVIKVDTTLNSISVVGSTTVRTGNSNSAGISYASFMVTPEEDYIMVVVSGREFMTGNSNYEWGVFRVNLNSATGSVSGSTEIANGSQGTSSVYRYAFVGDQSYYTTDNTNLGNRYIFIRTYYSTSFESVTRVDFNGGKSTISNDLTGSVGSSWAYVDNQTRSYAQQLHYMPTTNKLGYQRYLTYFTNGGYWGQLDITPETDAVPFQSSYCLYIDEEPDGNNIVRYVMWSRGKFLTTYQIQVDPTGTTAPIYIGQRTTTITDPNVFLTNANVQASPQYGNRFAKLGDDVYFTSINDKFTSDSTDSPTDYQVNLNLLKYNSANNGYFTLEFKGLVDARIPSTGINFTPQMQIDENGTWVITTSSDWSTSDGINDHKYGLFKVTTDGLPTEQYSYKVKAVALEDATEGGTFNALSFAPVVSDPTLVAGTVYDRHIATSNGLLLEKE
jgi:hypothetical protein